MWKPVKRPVRFLLVDSHMGKTILMSNRFDITGEEMILAYAFRYKIEPGFNDMKNTLGCFEYHFWTTALDKRKRWKKSDTHTAGTDENRKVAAAKKAMPSYVCLGTIAMGILTIISFACAKEVWSRYPGWVRTLRSKIPSIATTKSVLVYDFPHILSVSSCLMGFNFIKSWQRNDQFIYVDILDDVDEDSAA